MKLLRVFPAAVVMLAGLLAPASPVGAVDPLGMLVVTVKTVDSVGDLVDLKGATVTMTNLETGETLPVDPEGSQADAVNHSNVAVPYGTYRVQALKSGYATRYWLSKYSSSAAQPIRFSADGAVHRLTITLEQPVPLSGKVLTRSGRGVSGAEVLAQRNDEPSYEPMALTGSDGAYSMQLPPGSYTLSVEGRRSVAQAVDLQGVGQTRDLTLLEPPGPVKDISLSAGDSQATVTWSAPTDDGGSDITEYRVATAPEGGTCVTALKGCTLTGLQNGQGYRVTVTAVNDLGMGEPASSATLVTPTAGTPGPVRDVKAFPGNGSIDVHWSAPERGTPSGYTARAFPGGRSCSTNDLQCTIEGLRNGRPYQIEVTSRADSGESEPVASNEVTPIGPPSAPRNVKARPIKRGLRITWNEPLDDGGDPVSRYVATVWPGGKTCATQKTTCKVRKLKPRTNYSVTVRARNAAGEGPISPGSVPVRPRRR